ncbi:MAG TPA: PEP-utilizing enzyme [Thermoleophilaceae bacterium]|jgi:pyruvate,water dikinase|nr:PEP-utilizing enzyme [Thermoleophilaceae bacterium]
MQSFMSPFEVAAPEGVGGWESMYPYYALFRENEEQRSWFRDGMHFPEPIFPFDFVTADSPYLSLGQANSRIFLVPPALGIDHRVLYGRVYMSPNGVADPAEIGRRAEQFQQRAGYYFQNWDDLYGRWQKKVEDEIRAIETLEVPELPQDEDAAVVTEARGIGSSHTLLVAYNRLLESVDRIWQYHFEFLNLGYAALLAFYELCKQAFPDIPDQAIAKMVSGIDVVLFRPDEELKRLAQLAIGMGVAETIKSAADEDALRAAFSADGEGRNWLADWDATKQPWFNYSNGNGFYHHHRSWIDDAAIPLGAVRSYIERLEAGEEISRPLDAVIAERDRVTAEYRELLPDDDTRQAFDEGLGLSRTVFPYVESHNFYVEHWYHTLFWNKVREFGELLAQHGFLHDPEDVFYLQRHELNDALVDLRLAWAAGSSARGPSYWPPIVEERKRIMEAMRGWSPPPALGAVPEAITEPMTIMLWGITTERVQEWATPAEDRDGAITGFAGSPGSVEGVARVVLDVRDVGKLEEGEILVAPVTSPSWTPVFGKVAATVSDIGGIMSHAAIVAREYGMPAVVGTGNATAQIKTGDRVRVDGDAGVVTILP